MLQSQQLTKTQLKTQDQGFDGFSFCLHCFLQPLLLAIRGRLPSVKSDRGWFDYFDVHVRLVCDHLIESARPSDSSFANQRHGHVECLPRLDPTCEGESEHWNDPPSSNQIDDPLSPFVLLPLIQDPSRIAVLNRRPQQKQHVPCFVRNSPCWWMMPFHIRRGDPPATRTESQQLAPRLCRASLTSLGAV